MKNTASDGTGLSRLEISFSFKPKHGRKNGNDLRNEDRCIEPGNIPRVLKLMALAIRFDGLVRRGEVRDYADLARLGYVPLPPSPGFGPDKGSRAPCLALCC